jgi:hypothetical protein
LTLAERLDAAPLVGLAAARWRARRRPGSRRARCATRPSARGRRPRPRRRRRSRRGGEGDRAAADGHAFELSAEFATWRVVARDAAGRSTSRALRGETIEADLAARDFTVGRRRGPARGGEPIDPYGGLAISSGGCCARSARAASRRPAAPAARRAARRELGLEVDPSTAALARAEAGRAAEPAGERQLAELRSCSAGPTRCAASRCSTSSAHRVVLPELEALRGVEQGPNHHLDVHGHTSAVLERTLEVEDDLERFAGERAAEVAELLAEPLADEMSRGTALRFARSFHAIASRRPGRARRLRSTSSATTAPGRRSSGGSVPACAPAAGSAAPAGATRQHLRLGFMVHEAPLPPRRVHEYLRATEPVAADVTLLTVADRLSARGSGPFATEEAIEAHLELAREMLAAALDWRRDGPAEPLLRGDELAAELGIEPGPELGELLPSSRPPSTRARVSTARRRSSGAQPLRASEPRRLVRSSPHGQRGEDRDGGRDHRGPPQHDVPGQTRQRPRGARPHLGQDAPPLHPHPPGDRVKIELSPYDLDRGRITYRYK